MYKISVCLFLSVSLSLSVCLSHQTLSLWLNTDIKQAMLLRGKCRKQKKSGYGCVGGQDENSECMCAKY